MALTILNNISSMTAQNALSNTQSALQKTLTQLSTGMKINSGSDDAAGLSIVSGMNANISALTQSQQNASNGIGMLQTADGALSQVTTLLNRAVTLATEGSTSGITASQSAALDTEFQSILGEINQIGQATNFNGANVFSSNSPDSFVSTQGSATNALNATNTASGTNLTAGSVTSITDKATGGTFVYTATSTGNGGTAVSKVSDLIAAIAGAVTAGTLSKGTTAQVNASTGKLEIGPNAAGSGLTVSSNDLALGTMEANTPTTAYTSTQGTSAVPLVMNYSAAAGTGGDSLQVGGVTTISDTNTGGTLTFTAKSGDTVGTLAAAIANAAEQGILTQGTSAAQLATGKLIITGGAAAVLSVSTTDTTTTGIKGTYVGSGTGGKQIFTSANAGTLLAAYTAGSENSSTAFNTGDTVKIQDSAKNNTFTFTAASGQTIADLQQQIIGAVANGTLSAGTSAKINNSGQMEIDSTGGTAISVIASSSATALGAMNTTPAVSNNTNTVYIGDGVTQGSLNTTIQTTINALSATALNLNTNSLSNSTSATTALSSVTSAINSVSAQRGVIGASVNRLTAATSVMANQVTNLQSAANSLQNADIGKTVANMTQYNVLQSTGMAALQQSNQAQQAVLKLVQ